MDNHLTERQLKRYLHAWDELSREERRGITQHLQFCKLCREHLKVVKTYLNDVEYELSQPVESRDYKIVSKILQKPAKIYKPSGTLENAHQTSIERYRISFYSKIISYVYNYPMHSTAMATVTAAVVFLLLFMKPWVGINPWYAEVRKNVVRVFNKDGDVIWNLKADGIPEGISSEDSRSRLYHQYLLLDDIDGNKTNELIIHGDNRQERFTRDSLYCFNYNGDLRWSQGVPAHPPIINLKNANIGWWDIINFFSMPSTKDAHPNLFVLARAGRWSPSVFYKLDPLTGKIDQKYWHAGQLQTAIHTKIKGRGNTIILGGINDIYNRACLIALNPEHFNGKGPGKGIFKPGSISSSKDQVYLTFKPTKLSKLFNTTAYNQVKEIFMADNGNIIVRTKEWLRRLGKNRNVNVYYVLDNHFRVMNVYGDDNFEKLYGELYRKGKLHKPLTNQYWEQMKNSVLYWNGKSFVHAPG